MSFLDLAQWAKRQIPLVYSVGLKLFPLMGLQLELGLADYEERAIQLLTAATSLLLFLFGQRLPLEALVPRYFLMV